uniref:DUF6598 domain-containing protein n=1 Tax=Oryza glumipatula TaxID=40148 RepID=A0A0E0BVD0_9ORYZ
MDERESAIAEEKKVVVEEEEEVGDLEPFFYDEAAAVVAEKRRLQEEAVAAGKAERGRRRAAHRAVLDRISERDLETGETYYTRYHDQDLSEFNVDKVSPLPPMRFTAKAYRLSEASLYILNMVNVLAIRIDDGDVPFPIAVYGSVIARDDLDHNAEDDKQISKTVWRMNGVFLETIFLSQNLLTAVRPITIDPCRNLYPLQLMYAFVSNAVEATVSVKVLQGHFYGKITALHQHAHDGTK